MFSWKYKLTLNILNPAVTVYGLLFNVTQRCILPTERIYIYIYIYICIYHGGGESCAQGSGGET